MAKEHQRDAGSPLLALAIVAVIFLVSLVTLQPPPPKPTTTELTEFSADRAREVLRRLVGDAIPHPSGSPQNDVVRGRVIDELAKIGYKSEVQTGFSCDEYGDCGSVKNVIAQLDGTEPGQAVLVAAHYDSVAAGPGASDDGVGAAAVLEIARALKARPAPRHPVVILIDDGEEAGLLGARVFVDQHPWAREIRAAVNIDNRGTSGPSLMFETGSANQWVMRVFAANVKHPATSSIFYTAYQQLQNDTDFTVFKAAGYQGVNFAIIGDEPHYHTPLDNFENASPASLQDHGNNGLAMASAFANADLNSTPESEAVFFDVFNRWTICWPANWNLRISFAALFLLILEIGLLIYWKRSLLAEILWGIVFWILALGTIGVTAVVLRRFLEFTGAQPVDWIAHPLPALVAFFSLPIALIVMYALISANRTGVWGLWAGVWIGWSILSVVASRYAPGASYLLLVPACVAVLAMLPLCVRRNESLPGAFVAALLPLIVAGVLGSSLTILLYPCLGAPGLVVVALNVGLLLSPLSPIVARYKTVKRLSSFTGLGAAFTVFGLAAFAAFVAPAYSAKSREHMNIEYVQDADSGKSQWAIWPGSGKLPEPVRVATNFKHQDRSLFPWEQDIPFLADAPHLDLAPPTFTILESSETAGKRVYRALIRSERGASDAAVFFAPDSGIADVRMEGSMIQQPTPRILRELNGWYHFECSTMPTRGVELTFALPAGKPTSVVAMDETYTLPLEGSFLSKARPLTTVQFGEGDRTLVIRRVQLLP